MKKISRKEAIAEGLTKYFTGKPCPKGHISERTVVATSCVTCTADARRRRERETQPSINARNAAYRASKIKRTPVWFEKEEIREFYKNCPKGYHVDHIVPLRGDNVSGLHVLSNLQYLTMEDNSAKKNRYEAEWIQKEELSLEQS